MDYSYHRSADQAASSAIATLYHRAFAEFGAAALWNRRASTQPTIGQALVVAEALRREGDLRARRLAGEIEAACHAHH